MEYESQEAYLQMISHIEANITANPRAFTAACWHPVISSLAIVLVKVGS